MEKRENADDQIFPGSKLHEERHGLDADVGEVPVGGLYPFRSCGLSRTSTNQIPRDRKTGKRAYPRSAVCAVFKVEKQRKTYGPAAITKHGSLRIPRPLGKTIPLPPSHIGSGDIEVFERPYRRIPRRELFLGNGIKHLNLAYPSLFRGFGSEESQGLFRRRPERRVDKEDGRFPIP